MDTIAEIKQALEAITPGEWEYNSDSESVKSGGIYIADVNHIDYRTEDAEFIAAAPDWLRALLPVVMAARALMDANKSENEDAYARALIALQTALDKLETEAANDAST